MGIYYLIQVSYFNRNTGKTSEVMLSIDRHPATWLLNKTTDPEVVCLIHFVMEIGKSYYDDLQKAGFKEFP